MTDVTFTFNAKTRSLKRVARNYVGQAFDSYATTLHIEYDPIDFLSGNSELMVEGYIPYIQFNVYDDYGNPLIYSQNSTPVFDGHIFDIPWDVTSRVKSPNVEFQLFFVRNDVDLDGREIAQLDSTEYLLSNIASIAFSKSIKSLPGRAPTYPSSPQTEPSVMGYINLFKDYAILSPVRTGYSEDDDRLFLKFSTYSGRVADCKIILNVPYLDDNGKIPPHFISMISEWFDGEELLATDNNLPTALLVYNALNGKSDKVLPIFHWQADWTYFNGSVVLGSDYRIYRSLEDNNIGNDPTASDLWLRIMEYDNIINEWSEEPSEEKVPSEALMTIALAEKADRLFPVAVWDAEAEYSAGALAVGSDCRIYRSLEDDNIGNDPTETEAWTRSLELVDVATTLDDPTDDTVPSTALLDSELLLKTDVVQAVPWWDAEEVYNDGAVVIREYDIYISKCAGNQGIDPLTDDGTYWTLVRGSGSGDGNVVSRVVGDGVNTHYTLYHGFDTYEVFVQIRDNEGRLYSDATVKAESRDHIRVIFTIPPPPNMMTVIIGRHMSDEYTLGHIRKVIGDGVNTTFEIEHHFGTYNFLYGIRERSSERLYSDATVRAKSLTTAEVSFTEPPPPDGIVVFMTVCPVSDFQSYVHEQLEPSDTWEIEHSLERVVSIYTVSSDGYRIQGEEWQDSAGMKAIIRFSQAYSGYAVLR